MRHVRTLADATPTPFMRPVRPQGVPDRTPPAYRPAEGQPLSPREADVEALIVRGLLNKEIARTLGLSAQTIKNHITNIHRKRGVISRFELMARYYGGEIVVEAPPAPRPVRLVDQPCAVLIDGTLVSGTCTGTFLPSTQPQGE